MIAAVASAMRRCAQRRRTVAAAAARAPRRSDPPSRSRRCPRRHAGTIVRRGSGAEARGGDAPASRWQATLEQLDADLRLRLLTANEPPHRWLAGEIDSSRHRIAGPPLRGRPHVGAAGAALPGVARRPPASCACGRNSAVRCRRPPGRLGTPRHRQRRCRRCCSPTGRASVAKPTRRRATWRRRRRTAVRRLLVAGRAALVELPASFGARTSILPPGRRRQPAMQRSAISRGRLRCARCAPSPRGAATG